MRMFGVLYLVMFLVMSVEMAFSERGEAMRVSRQVLAT